METEGSKACLLGLGTGITVISELNERRGETDAKCVFI